MTDAQSTDDRPPTTEAEFLKWDRGPQDGPCPWCDAEEKPAPEVGKGATVREHADSCRFMRWWNLEEPGD